MDPVAERWICAHVEPVGIIETTHERPWSTVRRVPLADGVAWFKACAPVQAFEPRLTAELLARWHDRVTEVLGHDEERGWLLLADAGTPLPAFGDPPDAWLAALPLYAELQCGEAAHARDHLAHGVPDLRVPTLPARYEDLLKHDLPLEWAEIRRLRELAPRFGELCGERSAYELPETVQHDDLHTANVYVRGEGQRLLDWAARRSRTPSPARGHVPGPRGDDRAAAGNPWFARARRVSRTVGSRSRRRLRARVARGCVRALDRPGSAARAPADGARSESSTSIFRTVLRRALAETSRQEAALHACGGPIALAAPSGGSRWS